MQAPNDVYSPAEDTFFLEDHICNLRGSSALDIGCGSGYLARRLAKSFDFVVGTDINLTSLCDAGGWTGDRVCCSGADALSCLFDLIVCNPPYLATDAIEDVATDGGPDGIPVPLQMIRSAVPLLKPGGRLIFVTSSLSDHAGLIKKVQDLGTRAGILARKKLFFEELILVEARLGENLDRS